MSEIFKSDFSKIINLKDQNIIYSNNSKYDNFSVTVGIPTYKRKKTLERSLISLSRQTFKRFRLIISDNAGVSRDTLEIVKKFSKKIPSLYLISQENNIGCLGNIVFLLNCSSTEYFMWLADDDEISEDYIETLYKILESNPDAVTAMGSWKKMKNEYEGEFIRKPSYSSSLLLVRIIKHILGIQNDSAFYGLHRRKVISNAKFEGFLPPNNKVISNYCYLILFDNLLRGKILFSDECFWISHSYSDKSYEFSSGLTIVGKFKILLRRFNLYFLYCLKIYKFNKPYLPFIFLISFLGLLKDISISLSKNFLRLIFSILKICTNIKINN